MPENERVDDGMSADEAAAEGIGQKDPIPNLPPTTAGIVPSAMAPGVIAPVGGAIEETGVTSGDNLPDEVNPEFGGINSGADVDKVGEELDRLRMHP